MVDQPDTSPKIKEQPVPVDNSVMAVNGFSAQAPREKIPLREIHDDDDDEDVIEKVHATYKELEDTYA